MKNLPTQIFILLLSMISTVAFSQTITGKAGKIWYADNHLFINMVDKGVLVVNNENPLKPQKMGFIEIPGNVDLAVKGNTLYANNYSDLVVLDISKYAKVGERKILRFKDVFPQYGSSEGKQKISWVKPPKKSWMSSSTAMISSGKGGSMACITINGDYLYTINTAEIDVFNIKNEKRPTKVGKSIAVKGENIETIFTDNKRLYIGAQKGMSIYGLNDPRQPEFLGEYEHTQSCDPVVVEGNRAYLTLRDGTECNRKVNRLEILDISNPRNPRRISSHKMTNPHGLAVENGTVFLCDGKAGLKIIDASNPRDIDVVQRFETTSNTYDVINIPNQKLLIMVTNTIVKQYNYNNIRELRHLSDVRVSL